MSRSGIIEAEPISPDDKCELCGAVEETRPYGPNGERVCFDCGMKDEPAAIRQFSRLVLGVEDRGASTVSGPKGFADLGDLPEDERIKIIAHQVRDHGLRVAVCVDDEPGKPERYAKKLEANGCRVVEQIKGPTKGVVTLKVEPVNVN